MNEILERIDSAVKQYQEAISMHFEDGVPRWERYNVTRKIAQAACNYGGYIVTGTRHYCPIMHMEKPCSQKATFKGRKVLFIHKCSKKTIYI